MLAAGVTGKAGKELLRVTVDQAYAPGQIELDHRQHIIRINAAVCAGLLPGLAGVINVFVLLQPDARMGKQVHAVGVVPMHVGDHHVGDVLWFYGGRDAGLSYGIRGVEVTINLPVLEELWPVKAGVNQNDVPVAADQPDRHGEIELALRISAGYQRVNVKVRDGSIADGIDFIHRPGFRRRYGTGHRGEAEQDDYSLELVQHFWRSLKKRFPR